MAISFQIAGQAGHSVGAQHGIEQIIPEPGAQAHMPAAPIFGNAAGDIGIIEVFGENEAENVAQTNGHIGITGEVKVELQGIEQNGCPVAQHGVAAGGKQILAGQTAGVGENAPHIRRMVVERINCLGFKIDRELNDITRLGKEGKISTKDSKYDIYVVPTKEELMMARDCVSLIK